MKNWHRHGPEGWERRMRMNRGNWGYRRPKHNIPVNIIEHDDSIEVRIHALTFDPDDIVVSVTNNVLYISGQREPEVDKPNFLLQEYPIKSFERSFELGNDLDIGNIEARMRDGVLAITIPHGEKAQEPDIRVEIR